jgi:hypothetical protein
MPQIVAAVVAKSAMAAPVVTAAAAPTLTTAGSTAALELAKQKAIQASMQQMAAQGTKQAAVEATKQAGVEAAKQAGAEASRQGIMDASMKQMAQQGLDPSKLDYLRSSTASLNPTAPSQFLPPKAPAGDLMSQIDKLGPANFADEIAASQSGIAQGAGSSYTLPGSTPIPSYATPAAPLSPAGAPPTGPVTPKSSLSQADAFRAITPEEASLNELRRSAASTGEKFAAEEAAANMSPLQKGVNEGLNLFKEGAGKLIDIAKDKPLETSLGLMSVGQLMNQPKQGGEDKNKYKNTVDMSEFQPSIASVEPFTPSYEYQKYAAEGGLMKYAVGGPVETMSAQNAVGGNMMYPQAGLQTALYSNPMVQRPEAVNVVSPGEGPAVGAYSGEQKFAEGGLSEAQRREYGLQTRSQRASRSLTKSYEEMEKEREKELMNLLGERSDPGIIPRSRTQQLSSPFSAAMAEHARLAKKNKVPVTEMPKTSLGDIDTYMDTPIEAASGGIMHGLGGYSDGGRLLRGPGDGVSDSIPAVIGKRQPARLADGEFVIPARIVSELGNGSTEAGARKLYAMMERVQKSRKKSIGKKKVAVNSKADKHLPA